MNDNNEAAPALLQRSRAVHGSLMLSTQGDDIDQMVTAERLAILKVGGVASANAYTDTVAAQGLPFGKAYTDLTAARLQNEISDNARRAYAGIAGVAAMEAAPVVPGKVSYAVGLGNFRSENAMGGSLRRTSEDGRYSVTFGAGVTSSGVVSRVAFTGVFD